MQNEKLDWSHVIKTVRAFVLSRCKTDADTLEYIKIQMLETDTFHDYYSMDRVYSRLTDVMDDRIWEALAEAVETMAGLITDHFADPWNFAPGYVKPKLKVDVDYISSNAWNKLLKDAAPAQYAELQQKEKERKAQARRERKERAAEIDDVKLAALAKLYNAALLPACDHTLKSFAKHGVNADDVWFFEMTKEELAAFKTGAAFYAALQAKFTNPAKLVEKCLDLVTCNKAFTDERTSDVYALFRDPTGRKRLVKAVNA